MLFFRLFTLTALSASGKLLLLNDPEQKKNVRLESLKALRNRIGKMDMVGPLADQAPAVAAITKRVDEIMDDKTLLANTKAMDSAVKEVMKKVEDVKAALMKKAMDIANEHKEMLKEHEAKKTTETVFDELMNIQDAPLKDQLAALQKHSSDPFVQKFIKSKFQEGDNLAMLFGQALDDRVANERKEKEQAEVDELTKSAHLSEAQARAIVPILSRVKSQRAEKEQKLHDVEEKLQKTEETARFYKKHKAILTKETGILGSAIDAIEHGKIKALDKAMAELKKIGV